jgi:geranylgeranyl pyrophosphate synthase
MERLISAITQAEPLEKHLAPIRDRIEAALHDFCEQGLTAAGPQLSDVIRYVALGGGKRFRGTLVVASYEAANRGGRGGNPATLAAAVEVVHAYSLVHDDLPCMDDDDVRRGRPSAHRRFGVGLATLAGVAMVPLATQLAFSAARSLGASAREAADIVAVLLRAAGAGGMIAGQLLDLEGEGKHLSLPDLQRIHAAKTGALIAACAAAGAMAAGADREAVAAMRQFGEQAGLAFQISDDVLDVTRSTEELGKTAGKDAAVSKSTYPALLGLEAARERALAHAQSSIRILKTAGLHTPLLDALATYVVVRRA